MANLRIGSSGDEVKKLQNALISAGYNVGGTGADGVFGKNTDAAVRQYQRDNQLAVDGIAGQNTLGKLYGTGTVATSTPVTPQATTQQNTAAANTAQPDAVQQADALIQQLYAKKPGDYTPVWLDEADSWLSQYQNQDDFSYDVNSDALYQQYKDQYIQQGQLAMMDAMGQAAAMTGGYGNSYVQSAGQQAFNQYLGQLNNVVPELYGMAYDRYQQEGQHMLDMYDLYMNREAQERANHQTELDNWYDEMALLTGERSDARSERDSAKSDLVNLIATTGYKPTDAELQAAGMTRSQADSYATAYSTSSKDTGWQHVASVSDAEIVNNLANFKKKGDNVGLGAYLTMLENSKRIDQAMSDELYAAYVTEEDDDKGVDTTVGIIPNYDQKWLRDPKLR